MEDGTAWIVGTWKLLYSVLVDAQGNKQYPYGQDAVGYIYYSSGGIMAVQISRKERSSKPSDVRALEHEYLAYFGRYEVDAKRKIVRHFVEGQLFPGERPEILERSYECEGDLMRLRPLDGSHREIAWRRVNDSHQT